MNLPYAEIIISIMMVFSGLSMFAMSFSKKHHENLSSNFSEKVSRRAKVFFRYGGLGIILISFFIYSSSKYTNAKIDDKNNVFNKDKIELLQSKAGNKQESGWYKGEGGDGKYSVMFPAKFKEYKIPTKNNNKCPLYYSASTTFNGSEYLVEYIQCGNFDTREIAQTMISQANTNPNIVSIKENDSEGGPMLDIIANTPEGKTYIKAIYSIGGQYSLTVRSKDKNNINNESMERFFNSFKIRENKS